MSETIEASQPATLCQYYTRIPVSRVLVNALGRMKPASIVDLGAGAGALSSAAIARWKNTEVVTVDIDESARNAIAATLSRFSVAKHQHFTLDALDADLPKKLLRGRSPFDAGVCNPPYSPVQWRPEFSLILRDAGLPYSDKRIMGCGNEALFIAQNLRLIRDAGKLGVIVPDWVITGTKYSALRRALIEQHGMDTVIQIPAASFFRTEARSYILVLRKNAGAAKSIKVVRMLANGALTSPLHVATEEATGRLDYDFKLATVSWRGSSKTLAALGASVCRGNLSSAEIRKARRPTFHTTDFSTDLERIKLRGSKTLLSSGLTVARPGDILLARVDRRLDEKVVLVASGYAILSDCVYRIRLPAAVRSAVLSYLRSTKGRKLLRALARGVGARMLSKSELLAMKVPSTMLSSGRGVHRDLNNVDT